jgi:hypothetical protein
MSRWLLLIGACVLSGQLLAEVYRWLDENGNVVYSDRPHPGAEKLQSVPVQTIPLPLPATADVDKPSPRESSAALNYLTFAIIAPTDEQNLYNPDDGNVEVEVLVEPSVNAAEGHKLQLMFDGLAFGKPGTATEFILPNVDRGVHVLQAVITGSDGKIVTNTPKITFYLHKQSVLHPAAGR